VKTIPVTPELIAILENALLDSYSFINECEAELKDIVCGTSSHNLVVLGIERRKQQQAILRDLLDRYKA